ncbi:MAG: phosphotransferase family protein [Candidatus Binataceae bacterium]|nr:phosphotransferase family protein [Candidatus Binataceae bacterium]
MRADSIQLAQRLTAFIREHTADNEARVSEVVPLPGHAGVSYRFLHEGLGAGAARSEALVIRLAPLGVPPIGPNDIARQGRIMAALAGAPASRVAVPPIRWWGEETKWFGRPFFIADFVAGDKPALGERIFSPDEMRRCSLATVEAAAALHRLDWRSYSESFGAVIGLASEIAAWDRLLQRPLIEKKLIERSPILRARLLAAIPATPRVGCVHGDFQWSNCLFKDGSLAAIIDWELAHIGAVMLDLGWLCMFSDRGCWVTGDLVPSACPAPEEIAESYQGAAGERTDDNQVRWFRALSCFRFGAITAFNLMLHRRGKRPDEMWETFALSAPRLFERGLELLG